MSSQLSIRESFLTAKKEAASIATLGCGDYFRGLRYYIFRDSASREIFLVDSSRRIYRCEPLDRGGWRAVGDDSELYIDNLSLPYFQSWDEDDIRNFVRGDDNPILAFPDLFLEARDLIASEVEAPEDKINLFALFAIYSYFFHAFPSAPYLSLQGSAGSGKTRAAGAILKLAFNGSSASGQLAIYGKSSPAGLFRGLADNRGLAVLDDIEVLFSDKPSDLRRGLLTGYRIDSAHQILVERGRSTSFSLFGPKIFSSINPIEPTLASRCIIAKMQKSEIIKQTMDADRVRIFRQKMHLMAMTFFPIVDTRISDRRDEIMAPLRYFAKLCGVDAFFRGEDTISSVGGEVKKEIKVAKSEGRSAISSIELKMRLALNGIDLSSGSIGSVIADHGLAEVSGRDEIAKIKTTIYQIGRGEDKAIKGFCAQARRRAWKSERCDACKMSSICEIRKSRTVL